MHPLCDLHTTRHYIFISPDPMWTYNKARWEFMWVACTLSMPEQCNRYLGVRQLTEAVTKHVC